MIQTILHGLRAAPVPTNRRKPLRLYTAVWRQRQALHGLTNAELKNLGLTREAAEHEANRPFWDLRGIG